MAETSATLLKRLNNRSDSVAWQRLVDLYSPLINAWLRRQGVSAEDADDLSQEVLGIVVREVAQFRHNGRAGAFRTWLRTITTNCLRQFRRSRRSRVQTTSPPNLDTIRPGMWSSISDWTCDRDMWRVCIYSLRSFE
jgi:DNA-directed RNA polymerase specialized sigma24 family protein